MKRRKICNLYKDSEIPPCAQYLGNDFLLLKDGKLIYRNLNRFFFFISLNSNHSNKSFDINIQINIKQFIIGLFLHEILQDPSKYQKDCEIDADPKTNSLIHKLIQNPPKQINEEYNYSLILVYSNQDSILNPFTYTLSIKPLVFYILLILNRIENHPGFFFVNNNYVTEDAFNFALASLFIECPMNELYNDKK